MWYWTGWGILAPIFFFIVLFNAMPFATTKPFLFVLIMFGGGFINYLFFKARNKTRLVDTIFDFSSLKFSYLYYFVGVMFIILYLY